MSTVEADLARLRVRLRAAIRVAGLKNREVERRMGFSAHSGYLSRLFSGSRQLKVKQVLDILETIGMPAAEFFQDVFPGAGRAEAAGSTVAEAAEGRRSEGQGA